MNTNIIAIDGPAASGKGTLARLVAEKLGYAHMDTGALYRAVGYEVLQENGNPEDENNASAAAKRLQEKISKAVSPAEILSNPALREENVGKAASQVAAMQSVRSALIKLQKDFAYGAKEGAVLDGRDIGTVICPDAPVKIFVTASTEIRAERRKKELQLAGKDVTYSAVLKDMRDRDARDAGRQTAPMRPADDAIILDTGDMGIDEVLESALAIIKEKLPGAFK